MTTIRSFRARFPRHSKLPASSFRAACLVIPSCLPCHSELPTLSFRAAGEESQPFAVPGSLASLGMTTDRSFRAEGEESWDGNRSVIPSRRREAAPARGAEIPRCARDDNHSVIPRPPPSSFRARLPRHSAPACLVIPRLRAPSFRACVPRHSAPACPVIPRPPASSFRAAYLVIPSRRRGISAFRNAEIPRFARDDNCSVIPSRKRGISPPRAAEIPRCARVGNA